MKLYKKIPSYVPNALLAFSIRFAFPAHRNIRDSATLTILVDALETAETLAILDEVFLVLFQSLRVNVRIIICFLGWRDSESTWYTSLR